MALKPNSIAVGIINDMTVSGGFQAGKVQPCVVDIHVGAVENIVLTRDQAAEFLHSVPGVIDVKLVGVSPDIQKLGFVGFKLYKLLC